MHEYTPMIKNTYKLPVEYREDVEVGHIIKILKEWQPNEEGGVECWKYLVQAVAQTFAQVVKGKNMKVSYMFVGPNDAGKSTYLRLLNDIFGTSSAKITLNKLGYRWSNSKLAKAIINIPDEIHPEGLTESALNSLRALTGSEKHQIKTKYGQPYDDKIICTHIFSGNTPPKICKAGRMDPAFWSRWIYLNWEKTFPRKASWYEKNILPQLPAFVKLSMDLAADIIREGSLIYTQDEELVQQKWLSSYSPLVDWVED